MKNINFKTQIAMNVVLKASQLCQQVQAEMVSTDAIQKIDRSPVTVADFGSQAVICKEIGDVFPKDVIVAEENADSLKRNPQLLERVTGYVKHFVDGDETKAVGGNSDSRITTLQQSETVSHVKVCDWIDRGSGDIGSSYWTLDPIDGTKGFLRGDQYAIALAWIVDGEVRIGVISCPNLPHNLDDSASERGCLFVAVRGEGTSIYTTKGELIGKAQVSTDTSRLAESFETTHGDSNTHTHIANQLGFNKPPLQIDSQAKYGVVARGEASLYIRLPNPAYPDYRECIWDHAAGLIVVKEAGGTVTDADGKPLNFLSGRRMTENRGVVATNGELHQQVLSFISSLKTDNR